MMTKFSDLGELSR